MGKEHKSGRHKGEVELAGAYTDSLGSIRVMVSKTMEHFHAAIS